MNPTILREDQFCHLVNTETGELELVEGPIRFFLPSNKQIYLDVTSKYVLRENQYVVVSNPYDKNLKKVNYGKKEIRKGPQTFVAYPGEVIGSVQNAEILNKTQIIVVKALKSFTDEKGVARKAGELYTIQGPAVWIPKEHEQKVRFENAITVSENEAIYVRNISTSELKLVKGPVSYVLGVDEEKYLKKLSPEEYTAVGIANREPSFKAFCIQVQKNEVLCVVDYKSNQEKYVIGPESHILGPHEGIKVLDISAGVPKQENQSKIACVILGPDFMNDSFQVRTKDNAVLQLELCYKWRFMVDDNSLHKLFDSDFIGFSCQSLRSRIREEASQHDFEKFHTNSSQILRSKLFKDYTLPLTREGKKVEEKVKGRFFSEFNLLIFEIDVKQIVPVDQEINNLLNESIKANMEIMCRKLNDNAETDAEKEKIGYEIEIAQIKKNNIEIDNNVYTKETVEKARIEGVEIVEKARAAKDAQEVLEESRLNLELKHMKEKIELLKGPSGDRYIQFVKALSLHENVASMTVVPTDTKSLFIPASHAALENNY